MFLFHSREPSNSRGGNQITLIFQDDTICNVSNLIIQKLEVEVEVFILFFFPIYLYK